MNRSKLGAKVRVARQRLGLRQVDVAVAARVSRQTVSNIENGRYGRTNIDVLDRIGDVLGIWFDLDVRSRAADLDRLVNAKHAALGEQVIDWICACPGWTARAEVSFAFGCDAGVVDILAYHAGTRMLAVIELKTGIYDVGELLGTLHRKLRLAKRIAAEQGWAAEYVSGWLVVSDSRTNRRRVAAHRALVSSQMPADGRQFASWFARPTAEIRGRTFWSNVSVGGVRRDIAIRERVKAGRTGSPPVAPRSPSRGRADEARLALARAGRQRA